MAYRRTTNIFQKDDSYGRHALAVFLDESSLYSAVGVAVFEVSNVSDWLSLSSG